jgi:hypothetical protein
MSRWGKRERKERKHIIRSIQGLACVTTRALRASVSQQTRHTAVLHPEETQLDIGLDCLKKKREAMEEKR